MYLISCLIAASSMAQAAPAKIDAKAVFESLKTMVGEWQGQSQDGRKIRHTMELIAGGSVLMERSWFEAHPGELMVTMFHLDKDKVMLTHYCVAKNQPRLEVTEVSGDGKTLLFTFRDGTNLKDRNSGHMDKASYTFIDKNTYTTKWTWYQQGKEQWMEEFKMLRTKGPEPKSGATAGGGHNHGG